MRLMKSQLTDSLTVHAWDFHLLIAPGDVVDVDRLVAPGQTVGDALGSHIDAFAPFDEAEPPAPAAAKDSKKPKQSPPAPAAAKE